MVKSNRNLRNNTKLFKRNKNMYIYVYEPINKCERLVQIKIDKCGICRIRISKGFKVIMVFEGCLHPNRNI